MFTALPRDLGVLLLNSDSISDAALAAPVLGSIDESARERKEKELRVERAGSQMGAALLIWW